MHVISEFFFKVFGIMLHTERQSLDSFYAQRWDLRFVTISDRMSTNRVHSVRIVESDTLVN